MGDIIVGFKTDDWSPPPPQKKKIVVSRQSSKPKVVNRYTSQLFKMMTFSFAVYIVAVNHPLNENMNACLLLDFSLVQFNKL